MKALTPFFALAALAPTLSLAQARVANETLTLPPILPEGEYALESAYSVSNALALATPPDRVDQISERASFAS